MLACGLASAALAAGCGSSHSAGTSADPASAIPASAAAYLGADVRPTGSERSNALAAGHSLTGEQNPYLALLGALRTPGSAQLDYGRDVAPWLGPHAGAYLATLSSGAEKTLALGVLFSRASNAPLFPFGARGAQGALVLDTRDVGRARAFVAAQASRAGAHAASYRGVAYQLTGGGVALGVVQRLVVIGSDAGMRGVIDTLSGGPSLAQASGYAKLLASSPTGALAHVYLNPAATPGQPTGRTSRAGLLALLAGGRETNISIVPGAHSLTLVADSRTGAGASAAGGLLSGGAEAAQAFEALPGDSWLALAVAHLGQTLSQDPAALKELASLAAAEPPKGAAFGSAISLSEVLAGVLKPLNEIAADPRQAQRDYTGWMGSAAIFAGGTGLLDLKAGVVIDSSDPARSRAAVGKLSAALARGGASVEGTTLPGTDAAVGVKVNGLPVVLYIANGRDSAGATKFVIGLGEESVSAALKPTSTLASASSTSTARSTLDEGASPSVNVSVSTLVGLLEAVGVTNEPGLKPVVPTLRRILTLTGGGHALGGGIERFKLIAELR